MIWLLGPVMGRDVDSEMELTLFFQNILILTLPIFKMYFFTTHWESNREINKSIDLDPEDQWLKTKSIPFLKIVEKGHGEQNPDMPKATQTFSSEILLLWKLCIFKWKNKRFKYLNSIHKKTLILSPLLTFVEVSEDVKYCRCSQGFYSLSRKIHLYMEYLWLCVSSGFFYIRNYLQTAQFKIITGQEYSSAAQRLLASTRTEFDFCYMQKIK